MPRREHNIQSPLPTGYRQLEYLESTGTQYINTGVYADTNTEVEVDVAWTRIFNDNAVIGMDAGNYMNKAFTVEYASTSNGISFTFDNTNGFPRSRVIPIPNRFYNLIAKKNGLWIDGTLFTFTQTYSAFSCPYPLFVFCYGRNGANILNGELRIALLKIGNNGNLQRNYLPSLRIADNKPGLYDLDGSICPITGTPFYVNAGTGEFLYA